MAGKARLSQTMFRFSLGFWLMYYVLHCYGKSIELILTLIFVMNHIWRPSKSSRSPKSPNILFPLFIIIHQLNNYFNIVLPTVMIWKINISIFSPHVLVKLVNILVQLTLSTLTYNNPVWNTVRFLCTKRPLYIHQHHHITSAARTTKKIT